MFKLNENYGVDRRLLKCDYIRYLFEQPSTLNTPNSQFYINIPRGDSVNSLLNSYLDLFFEVIKKAEKSSYASGNDIGLNILGPIALFSIFVLTTTSGKDLEDIFHAHRVSLMYKLLTSSRGSDDFSIGFDQNRGRRRDELTDNKKINGKFHVGIMLKDVFGFAQDQQKATLGLGCNLTETRIKDDAVVDKAVGI